LRVLRVSDDVLAAKANATQNMYCDSNSGHCKLSHPRNRA